MELKRLEISAGIWRFVYFWRGSCVTSASGMEWSQQERCGIICQPLRLWLGLISCKLFSIFSNRNIYLAFVSGGLLHCHVSIFDAGGPSRPWPHVTWCQGWNHVLPLSRRVAPHWPRGTLPLHPQQCLNFFFYSCLSEAHSVSINKLTFTLIQPTALVWTKRQQPDIVVPSCF